jgi:hypothetical protein
MFKKEKQAGKNRHPFATNQPLKQYFQDTQQIGWN